uniref:Uncharacterized protein n=1 Tax=Oryza meridionalis TaxID=40149 RepID=A0A0E0ETZ5_9ORYZ
MPSLANLLERSSLTPIEEKEHLIANANTLLSGPHQERVIDGDGGHGVDPLGVELLDLGKASWGQAAAAASGGKGSLRSHKGYGGGSRTCPWNTCYRGTADVARPAV